MKKVVLLFLLPLLMATQCEDDTEYSGFETTYLLQNNSSIGLFLLSEENTFQEIESQANIVIGSDLNSTTDAIVPSESSMFNSIKLYKKVNDDFILVYTQNPVDDSLWEVSESSVNNYEYKLTITDALLN